METTPNKRISFTQDQIDLIKKQIAPKATADEFKLFLYQAERTGLDPLTRQIYCIHRYDKKAQANRMTVQTSIDGFRVVAERSGEYGGQDEPQWIESDGKIILCKVPVYKFRGEIRYQAAVGVAFWDEYAPDAGFDYMWKKLPHTMIAKVAEALALRKAFPQDLSGLYTTEEMQQADFKEAATPQQNAPAEPLPGENVQDLHTEFMKNLNMLIALVGDDALRFHPDQWKKEPTVALYKSAIKDIQDKIKAAELV